MSGRFAGLFSHPRSLQSPPHNTQFDPSNSHLWRVQSAKARSCFCKPQLELYLHAFVLLLVSGLCCKSRGKAMSWQTSSPKVFRPTAQPLRSSALLSLPKLFDDLFCSLRSAQSKLKLISNL